MRNVLLLTCATLFLPHLVAADPPPAAREETARQYMQLQRHVAEQFATGRFDSAAADCRQMIRLVPDDPSAYYSLARALARLNKPDAAMEQLGEAVRHGYADPAALNADTDLAPLRDGNTTAVPFAKLMAKVEENHKNGAGKAYEAGAEIPGMRSIENEPAGGLRYRLRVSESATAEKPHRLLIWLHPSGASMNKMIEAVSPALAKGGYALLTFTQKQFAGWNNQEAEQLVEKTLPDVAKVPGVNADKPVLFGFSAGGQIALEMYWQDPGKWGGLILDAAYPIDMQQFQRGQQVARALPKEPAKLAAMKGVPLFVLIGEEDKGGAKMWRAVEPQWKAAGVPLRVIYVPGKGHAWLLGKAQWAELVPWLEEVEAGRVPGGGGPKVPAAGER